MKKILLISLVMLLAVSVSFSQFGIKGGINLATVSGDNKSLGGIDPTRKLGLAGGISYRIGLIAGLSLQPEVMYIQKGAIYEGNMSIQGFSISGKTTLSGNYIDIPVLVKFNLPIPMVSPYVEGGVSYGILLSAKQKIEAGGQTNETDIKDQLTKSDVSIIVGVGVELLILEIDARMVLGQTKLGKDNDAKVYNNGIIFTAGLRF